MNKYYAICAFATMLGLSSPALALQCPTAQPMAHPGVLKESKAQVAEMSAYLEDGNQSGDHAARIIQDLRRRYPGVANSEIQNYLLASYCPLVNRLSGLSDAEKHARMDRFAGQVSRMLAP